MRQIALGLNDEEVRGQADFEALLLGIEPLLGERASGARRVDAFGVHVDLPAGVADLLNDSRLSALEPLLGLRVLEPGACKVRLLDALSDRIGHAHADGPGGEVAAEQLTQH